MATHSSILAWRIPWTEEPGGLLSIGLPRVRDDWSDLACMHALEKEMATHSSILAWRILWTEEPGGLLSIGSHRVGHNWSDLACMHALEKEMTSHSSILAWRILWMEEPGGSHRVGHDWSDVAAAAEWVRGSSDNPSWEFFQWSKVSRQEWKGREPLGDRQESSWVKNLTSGYNQAWICHQHYLISEDPLIRHP